MSDKLAELEESLPKLDPALDRRRVGESLGKTVERLRDADRTADRLRAVLEIASEVTFEADPGQATALRELVVEAGSLANDLENAHTAEDLRVIQETYGDFTKSLVNVDRLLRVHWRRVADREFRPLVSVGELLENIGVASSLGQRLRQCGEEAVGIRDSVPAEVLRDSILRVRAIRSALEQERTSMTKDSEVDNFLTAVADGKATLSMITERVRDWLDRNNALDRFGVRPLSN